MREPYIRIGDEGEVIERGGWELPVNDAPDSDSRIPNQGNTPIPDLQEHDFEADRREQERRDIEAILNIDPAWLPN